ncbi:MAG: hypothetical protein IPK03_09185 [Bacteroidetes bacterium]|nr:hypothetical protein [Bacteroidota bacterium]
MTDSVIVDSLLGQGEALDCYNKEMQQANVEKTMLANLEMEKNIDLLQKAKEIIDQIGDPIAKAEAYKNMLGKCCDQEPTV